MSEPALKVTIEVLAADWHGVRLALRQAYTRDLRTPITHGVKGEYRYHLQVLAWEDVETDLIPPLSPAVVAGQIRYMRSGAGFETTQESL